MPRSSKASLSEETIQELENQFYDFLNSLNPEERRKFFSEFLTSEEKMMMYKRLALYWCLLEGYSLAKIQQMIGVTHDTTRVYNKKKNMLSEDFKSLLKRIGGENMTQPDEKVEEKVEVVSEEKVDTDEPALATEQTELKESQEVNEQEEVKAEEKKEDETEEKMDETKMPEMDDVHEVIEAKVEDPMMDKSEEKMDETIEKKTEESSGLTPSQSSDKNEEESSGDEGEGKKKSGLAKFFGF